MPDPYKWNIVEKGNEQALQLYQIIYLQQIDERETKEMISQGKMLTN